ncbi:hypothetical protein MPC1_6360001 [Methylocella tundrae]|nr:hypothetical protein MPC1_6360001 [Methylocella tundrae]
MNDHTPPTDANWIDEPNQPRQSPASHAPSISDLTQKLDRALMTLGEAIDAARNSSRHRVADFLTTDPGKASFRKIAGQLNDLRMIALLHRMFATPNEDPRALLSGLFMTPASTTPGRESSLDRLASRELLRRMLDDRRIQALCRACTCVAAEHKGESA